MLLHIGFQQVQKEAPTPKKKRGLTPKKLLSGKSIARPSPAGPSAVRTSNFQQIAKLCINLNSVVRSQFSLDKVYNYIFDSSVQLFYSGFHLLHITYAQIFNSRLYYRFVEAIILLVHWLLPDI